MLADFNLSGYEFRDVVGDHQLRIKLQWILLRQEERFQRFAVGPDPGDVRPSVKSVSPAAAEYQPLGITAPGMVALHIVRIEFIQGIYPSGLEVSSPEVCILVPDGEVPVP